MNSDKIVKGEVESDCVAVVRHAVGEWKDLELQIVEMNNEVERIRSLHRGSAYRHVACAAQLLASYASESRVPWRSLP